MAKPAMLLLLPFAIATQIEDPCQGMTVADCEIGQDNIVDRLSFDDVLCKTTCEMSDNCHYWRALQNATMELPQCLHLRTDFRQVMREGQKHTPCFRIVPVLRDPLTVTLTLV